MSETESNELLGLFKAMEKFDASDLHLKAGSPPIYRVDGAPQQLNRPPMTHQELQALLLGVLTEEQKRVLDRTGAADLAVSSSGIGRFRVNIYKQRGSLSMAARRVNTVIPTFEQLQLPPIMAQISEIQQGLVILAGVTGSGKSTTIASMVQYINERRRCHIVTIEDPIEYLFADDKAFVDQREVGIDVPTFKHALKYVVRQDPDVILIGEMRDEETFQAGLTAAETGHLVFGTLHSSTAPSTFGRILDLFVPERHDQIRQSLMFNLRAIVCQKLLPCIKPEISRVPAVEILLSTPIIRKLIREKDDKRLAEAIKGGAEEGMQDFNMSLADLVNDEFITRKTAFDVSPNAEALQMMLKGIAVSQEGGILG